MTLSNDAMRLVVVPDLGGKIVSLVSRSTGREWLWENPHLPLRKPPTDATDFGQFDSGGWDEIFPTVNPCRVPGSGWGDRALTDHGELWYRPWETFAAQVVPHRVASLTLAVDDADLPFRFERTLTLPDGDGPLTASYELTNRSDCPLPYIWAAHPLVAIEPGMRIGLPADTRVQCVGGTSGDFRIRGRAFTWPSATPVDGPTVDVSVVPKSQGDLLSGVAMKLFTDCPPEGCVSLTTAETTEELRLLFDSKLVAHVGLWLNYAGWSGAATPPYFNLGLEPTTSPWYAVSKAVLSGEAKQLGPRECHRWTLNLSLLHRQGKSGQQPTTNST